MSENTQKKAVPLKCNGFFMENIIYSVFADVLAASGSSLQFK